MILWIIQGISGIIHPVKIQMIAEFLLIRRQVGPWTAKWQRVFGILC
jgi:hypothetical protein